MRCQQRSARYSWKMFCFTDMAMLPAPILPPSSCFFPCLKIKVGCVRRSSHLAMRYGDQKIIITALWWNIPSHPQICPRQTSQINHKCVQGRDHKSITALFLMSPDRAASESHSTPEHQGATTNWSQLASVWNPLAIFNLTQTFLFPIILNKNEPGEKKRELLRELLPERTAPRR